MRVLVTGSSGFVGQNLCRFLKEKGFWVRGLDRNVPSVISNSIEFLSFRAQDFSYMDDFVQCDLGAGDAGALQRALSGISAVVHLASSSHVDYSISYPNQVVTDNVTGTCQLFEACRGLDYISKIILFSTDEVGACKEVGSFAEDDSFHCGSVYSASKAAQEHLAQAYIKKYNMPIYITRSVNIFGPHQSYDKFLPRVICNGVMDKEVPIYGHGYQTRQWVHVDHVCDYLNILLLASFIPHGKALHITGTIEVYNLNLASQVLGILNKPQSLIKFVEDRPGHDERYSMVRTDVTNQWNLPFYENCFYQDLMKTVNWYKGKTEELMSLEIFNK